MRRLPAVPGEWIDRSKPLRFEFEGRRCQGYAGDTVSSALLASGERVLGRSFKYHRPRSVLSFANHDVNVLLQHGDRLNVRGDVEPLAEGMRLTAVNTFGGVREDRARVLGRLSRFMPVGFYYKAFFKPRVLFPFWERAIRRMSGLGRLSFDTPHIRTAKRYDFCDVLVIGAGPAGLSAALEAARTGARVVVVDENPRAGGSLSYLRGHTAGNPPSLEDLLARTAATANIEIRTATAASGYYADHWVALVERDRLTKMRAKALVVAAGAMEQPAVFGNNDLPGVMLASAAQRLLHCYAVLPMQRAVVMTANAQGYAAALDLLTHGCEIAAIVDLRAQPPESEVSLLAAAKGIRIVCGAGVLRATGRDSVSGALIAPLNGDGEPVGRQAESVACDGLLMSVGYAPAATLLYQAGAHMRYDETLAQFVPERLPQGIFAAGSANGVYAPEQCVADGSRAGSEAAEAAGYRSTRRAAVPRGQSGVNHPYPIFRDGEGKNFVDFDEDLRLEDFENAVQEGFDSIELLKRYTTVGMGPSQGKHSSLNAIRILARLAGCSPGAIGTTTARPFVHPVPMSHLAGRAFHPYRETPMQARHEQANAVFMHAGVWLRPEYYAIAGQDKAQTVQEEAQAVRTAVGLIDVGTLGKIEVFGADAAAFLERVYTGRFGNLKVGRTRYALMLDEAGVIVDDGVVARMGEAHFYFTTTTTGSTNVYRELARLNSTWRMDVGIVNLTGHWSAMNLAGPRSRAVLAALGVAGLDADAFPYLGVRSVDIAGVSARLLRVGFVGELGYEIHVPADSAAHIWDALIDAGAPHGIRLFGVEAQRLLRLEKGHIIIGQDTDGLTTPFEAALGWALQMDKPFFIGQRSLQILQKQAPRQQLAGFVFTPPPDGTVPKECHLVIRNGAIAGRVTSIGFSPAVGRHVGLAFLAPDLARPGTRFLIRADGGRLVEAEVASTPFYDPAGRRQALH